MAQTKVSLVDLNSNELILDLDGDTTLHSSTDDQIDIKIAGADDFTFTAGAFNVLASSHAVFADSSEAKFGAGTDLQIYHDGTNSFIANKTGALKIATETSGIAITIGHTTSEVTVADNLTVTGTLGVTGVLTGTSLDISGDIDVDGTTNLDIVDIDGAVNVAADVTIASTNKIIFNDASQYIQGASNAILDIAGGDEIELTATLVNVQGNLAVSGTTAQTGVLTANAGVVIDNITIDGTEIDLSSGDLTIDVAGDIVLDADGGDVFVKDAGTTYGSLTNTSGNLIIKSGTTTAATFSGANVTFAGTVGSGAITSSGIVTGTGFTAGSAVLAEAELELLDGLTAGTAIASKVVTTDANIDSTGMRNLTISGELDAATLDISGAIDVAGTTNLDVVDIDGAVDMASTLTVTGVAILNGGVDIAGDFVIDVDGGDVQFRDGGAGFFNISNSSLDAVLKVQQGNQDFIIKGVDGSSEITALTLDMSAAGAATFNDKITAVGTSVFTNLDISGDVDVDGTTNLDIVDIDGALTQDGGAVFNEAAADVDFRIESSGNDHMFFVDAGNNHINIGTSSDLGGNLNVNGHIVSSRDDNGDNLTLISTDADANSGPNLRLYRNSSSPVNDDVTGVVQFEGRNNNSQDFISSEIKSVTSDVADGSEDGALAFSVMNAGTLQQVAIFTGPEVIFNETSNDLDFRVESNAKTHMLFVDSGNERLHFGGNSGDREFNFEGADNLRVLLRSSDNSTGACQLQFGDSDNSQIGRIMYEHDDNNMTFHTNATQFMELTSTGKVVLSGNTASSTSDLTSGGLHFHDASTSAGNIMPITFTPSATADRARAGIGFISQSASGSAGFAADITFYARSAADGTTMGTDDEALRINSNHEISTKETDPDVSSGGLCLNQGSQDSNILTFKSSDIAHNITGEAESDTYMRITKSSSTAGGFRMDALSEQGGEIMQFIALGNTGGGLPSTTTGTGGTGAMSFGVNLSANNDGAANDSVADAGNLAVFRNYTATQFIIKGNGAIHSNAAAGTYDSYEDAQLVRAFDLTNKKGVIASQFDKYVSYNHEALADAELVGRDEDGTPNMMMNITGFIQLHNGAIWQSYEKTEKLTRAMYELAKVAVGEDKANEILEQNEIKLLN